MKRTPHYRHTFKRYLNDADRARREYERTVNSVIGSDRSEFFAECNDNYVEEVNKHVDMLYWQVKQSLWISVEDAIPNKQAKGMCQVKYVDGSIDEMAMREMNKWIYPYINTGYVTHWRPIPTFDQILEANKDVLQRLKEEFE